MIDTDHFRRVSVEISERDAHNKSGRKDGMLPENPLKLPYRRIAEVDRGVPEQGQALTTPLRARLNSPSIEPPA